MTDLNFDYVKCGNSDSDKGELKCTFLYSAFVAHRLKSLFFFSPENFMKIMEKDAEDRRVRRIAKEKKATGVWISVSQRCHWKFTVFCKGKQCIHLYVVCCVTAALKDKGNEAYAQGDYETAVKYYSDGLAELRDMQPLYTNRAQVNIFSLHCDSCPCSKFITKQCHASYHIIYDYFLWSHFCLFICSMF